MSISSAKWRKASRSGQGNNCVEVALDVPGRAWVRDSKLGEASPVLVASADGFAAFLGAVKSGKYDR
ncbi:DUF397 domain-containing protein [Saccharopolyspora gregorii]|uniref:DUF397 domain-containing protein n=1 Tax=Saccharopolyspora gregorii TaxID=33914 RepID=A0ABP6RT48_9PSEU|nr:DUF397 domain-containing protein [Saccharopolyspora gregorii]